jgi:hypothetical protein
MKLKKILLSSFLMIMLISIGLCLPAFTHFSLEKRLGGEVNDFSRYADIRNQYQVIMIASRTHPNAGRKLCQD